MITKGDIIEIDLILKDSDSKEMLDTTFEKLAKENNLNPKAEYKPIKAVFGTNELLPAVEDKIKEIEAGKTHTFVLLKKDAFGERNPNNTKIVPFNDFKEDKIRPEPGMQVTIGNQSGKVISVSGGRVKVDFNPIFAGRNLEYTITVNKIHKEDKDKVPILVEKVFYFMKPEHLSYHIIEANKMIEVELPIGLPKEFDYFKELFAEMVINTTKLEKIKFSQVFSKKKE
ncbi:MAG: hypothetical protein WCF78_01955 [archaeon]